MTTTDKKRASEQENLFWSLQHFWDLRIGKRKESVSRKKDRERARDRDGVGVRGKERREKKTKCQEERKNQNVNKKRATRESRKRVVGGFRRGVRIFMHTHSFSSSSSSISRSEIN